MSNDNKLSWEEAVVRLQNNENYNELILNSYLTRDIIGNCNRFHNSDEFKEVVKIIKSLNPNAKNVMDLAAGNGIASYSFVKEGFNVTAIEPDKSDIVGSGAIQFIKDKVNSDNLNIISSTGEDMPVETEQFDVVYVRQALHHANDLNKMLKEIARVMKSGGILISTREHVVKNYGNDLQKFLDSHPIHSLYGGENAYTQKDYCKAIEQAGLKIKQIYGPFDNIINLFPNTLTDIREKIIESKKGRILGRILPEDIVCKIGISILKARPYSGKLFSFIAEKK